MYGATDTSSKSTLSTSLEHKAPLDGNNVGGCTDKAIYSRKEQDFIFVISRKHLQVTIASIVCGCCAVVFVPLFLSSSIGSSEYYHPNNPIRDWYRIREGIRKAKNAKSFLNTFSMDQATSKSDSFEMLALLAAEDYQKITFGSTEAKHHKHLDGRVANGCEATVQIIRHCEKDQSSSIHHCSYQGFERAQYLKTLYGTHRRWPIPSVIYALSGRRSKIRGHHIHFKKMVYREVETVLPRKYISEIWFYYFYFFVIFPHVVKRHVYLLFLKWLCYIASPSWISLVQIAKTICPKKFFVCYKQEMLVAS